MNITEIRIRLLKNNDTKLKAVATITIDNCFAIHEIKIIENDNDYFIAMPSKKTPSGEFKDLVHPLNTETREMMSKMIIDEFRKVIAAASEE